MNEEPGHEETRNERGKSMRKLYGKAMEAAILAAGLFVAVRAMAGSLDPTNTPGPTMHTLEEIYQKLAAGTFTLVATNTVTVTNTVSAFTNAPVAKTGQITSYRTGDDGDLEKGVARPFPRFTVQSDTNVVMDNLSGLMWARNANLTGEKSWANAIDYCRALSLGGHSD